MGHIVCSLYYYCGLCNYILRASLNFDIFIVIISSFTESKIGFSVIFINGLIFNYML